MADNKPAFDPNAPFQTVEASAQGSKPTFDPSAPFEAAPEEGTTNTDQLLGAGTTGGAIERGLKHGVSMGLEDRLAAAAGALGTQAGQSEHPALETGANLASLASAFASPASALTSGPIQDRLKNLYKA